MIAEDFEQVDYSVTDNVATVTLSRPERRNAWTGRMALEYRWALALADGDPDVGAIVVTGAPPAFCIGADADILAEVDNSSGSYERLAAELPAFRPDTPPALRHNHTYPLAVGKPVIAAINGACAGAGFVLACFADFRIAVCWCQGCPVVRGSGTAG
jgi:enoyl-CoA hydratase/carnithine racemase